MTLLRNLLIYIRLGLFLGCYLCSCAHAHAQTTPKSQTVTPKTDAGVVRPADITVDTRLDRRISLHEIGTPLDALLLKVNREDFALSADRNCAFLKIHLNLRNRPVRQLMNSLAQLVPGAWYPASDGKGYVLRMSPSAAIRRQRWWNLFLGERQQLWEQIPERALQAMQAKPEIKGEVTSADGNVEAFKQQLLEGPTFFNLLPPSLQEKVAHSVNQTPYYQERGIIWQNGMDEGATIVPFSSLPFQAQEQLSARINNFSPQSNTLDKNYVLFENVGSIVSAYLVNSSGDVLPAGFHIDVNLDAERATFRIDHEYLPQKVKKMGRNAPSVWRELAAFQESRVWPNNLPPKTHLSYDNRSEVLEWLADVAHLEFVADYYSLLWGTQHSTLPALLSRPLKEELNVRAAELDVSWKQQEDIYLFRNNRWYRDDGLEVPAPLLKRWLTQNVQEWAKAAARQSPPSEKEKAALTRSMLDWQAEVVSVLTPWQIFNGLAYVTVPPEQREQYAWGPSQRRLSPDDAQAQVPYTPFKGQVRSLVFQYSLMLLYASLSADQRTALLAGHLDFNSLTGDQKKQAIYLQPLLQIGLSRRAQPIFLGLRQRKSSSNTAGEADLHLVIAAPTMQ